MSDLGKPGGLDGALYTKDEREFLRRKLFIGLGELAGSTGLLVTSVALLPVSPLASLVTFAGGFVGGFKGLVDTLNSALPSRDTLEDAMGHKPEINGARNRDKKGQEKGRDKERHREEAVQPSLQQRREEKRELTGELTVKLADTPYEPDKKIKRRDLSLMSGVQPKKEV